MPDNKLINWLIGIAVIEGVVLETHRLFSEARSTKAAMKDLASDSISGTSGRLQLKTRLGWVGLPILLASFLAIISAGCGDGQPSLATFPRHDYPLGTDRGGEYFAGQLVLRDGCLRVEVPSHDTTIPGSSRLVIWPSSFTFEEAPQTVRVIDGLGRTAAQVGDHVRLSQTAVASEEAKRRELVTGLSEHCPEPSFLVGDEVTVFDPKDETTELRLSDPDVLFLRQETVIAVNRVFLAAAGVGELVLDGQCLRLKDSATMVWPAGFTPHVEGGVVHVRNGAGQSIARVGDEIAGGGGYSKSKHGECPGAVFKVHHVKVLPDVEVYFPKQDGTLTTDQEAERFAGKLVLDGKCLEVESPLRVRDRAYTPVSPLLIWPNAFSLRVEDGSVGIVDATGRVIARIGDDVQFSAFSIDYDQAMRHGGLEKITPACTGPYWAVEEDFAATETR